MTVGNIIQGWGRWLGIIPKNTCEKQAQARREICARCELSKKSKLLEIINGNAQVTDSLYCTACKCPIVQKSLSDKEFCKLNKW
jgi:hypothetical protein